MVKHQRRRATTTKVKRKADKKFFKKVQHDDAEVAKHWDFRKTREHNMKRLGLAHDVNRAVGKLPGAAPAGERVDQAVELEFVDIPQQADLTKIGTSDRRPPMSEDKQAYIVKLMAKYGDDCAKMARDVKRNPQQLTEAKLRKMVAKYDGLSDKHRLVARR
ncbi:ribosome biogenesis protein Nop16 [Aureococcus anophagefferens]|nr:ribosome biogenesis protein Nop16 [Aureococcus anophagefferens]